MIYLSHLLQATGGKLHGQQRAVAFPAYAFDSRQLEAGQLFVAVQTSTGDGHDYIRQAIERGAGGVLCQRPQDFAVTTVVVSNTKQALLDYARFILQKYAPDVIGVTGSTGKTTVKEAIAAVLSTQHSVFKNYGSYNDRYGLPLALGRLRENQEIAVLEMACDSFGEIAELAALAQPKIAVVTTVSPTHLAGLGSIENVALEKSQLVEGLTPAGTAILNNDDFRVVNMGTKTNAAVITYGFGAGAELQATDIVVSAAATDFTLHYQGQLYAGRIKLVGRHQVYAALAAIAVGLVHKIPIRSALAALVNLPRVPGRLHPLPGLKGSLLLDDTFNAGPASMRAALDTAAAIGGARIAVLGKMADLGEAEGALHAELGAYLVDKVDYLVTVGETGQLIGQAALAAGFPAGKLAITFTPADAAQAVMPHLSAQTVILLKGSAEARMERVVAKLLANPRSDTAKLARAEAGWEKVRIGLPNRPTWVELDLDALGANTRCLAELAHPAKLMAVLKADAYGHGAIKAAQTALRNGAVWVGVATLGEALTLRRAGIDAPILVLGYLPAWQAGDAIRHNIRATVFTPEVLQAFSETAQRLQVTARLHIKVDTGMGRLGLLPDEAAAFVKSTQLAGIELEGIFTHFGRADEADLQFARTQYQIFQNIIVSLEQSGLRPPIVHAANTAALLNLPEAHFNMVRSGIGLYGLGPSVEAPLPKEMKPVLTFKTTIAQVKRLPAGSPIGYGGAYVTQTEETIAVIPVGYADGFRRAPQTWREVLVKGERAPLVGRVSMDQSAINVSHIPNVRQGDEVVLIGRQGSENISVEEVAANLGTINYEVVSQILARVPRIS